jgi:hypothetical protein
MIVSIVLRSGQWLDLVKATIADRTVVLGVFFDPDQAKQVMSQPPTQAWVGVPETWIEERVIDALGPEHDVHCEMKTQPFCNCGVRADRLYFRTPIPTLQEAS